MTKKILTAALILILISSSSGCSGAWRRKFVRKKKAEVEDEPILQPMDYGKEFTNKQLYANHFAFWKSSEYELIRSIRLKRSKKRRDMYASYAQLELQKLYDLLIEEKQKELSPLLEGLKAILADVQKPNYLNSHRNQIISRLQKHYRAVDRHFSYYGMREYIRPDEDIDNPEKTDG